jgi:hypothetical protein
MVAANQLSRNMPDPISGSRLDHHNKGKSQRAIAKYHLPLATILDNTALLAIIHDLSGTLQPLHALVIYRLQSQPGTMRAP